MSSTLKRRTLVARAATLALAACGLFAGYQLGRVVALRVAENWLDQYSKLMAVQQDASSVEAHKLLSVLKTSAYPFCSDAEIAYFREMVFRSEYLKDAGRIHNGRIDCSATAGRPSQPIGEFHANTRQADGTIAYKNLLPVRDSHLKRAGLQLGTAYVVIGAHVPPSLGPIPINLNVTMQDAARPQPGAPPTPVVKPAELATPKPAAHKATHKSHKTTQAAPQPAPQAPTSVSAGATLKAAAQAILHAIPQSTTQAPPHVTVQPAPAPEAPQPGLQESGFELTSGGTVRIGDTLYTTQCSALHFNCVTASTSVSEALHGEQSWIVGCVLGGGALGLLLGVAFSMMYRRSRNMEQQLRRAIARDKLDVVYQPIVSLATGRIVGAESLVRWVDEEGNKVGPDVFVKVAEDHGFVGGITKLVVRRALRAFAETLRKYPDFRISVNASAADLGDPAFLPMLEDSLKRFKIPSRSLAIEITETSTANREVAMETIRCLRRNGHSIHIDDFGTGYSSLSYLLYLSVDTIKIDKAFTRVIGTEAVTVAILPQILAMAKSLGLEVIAEGIETTHQENYFSFTDRPMYGQGWLYGRPVPASEFKTLLSENWAKVPIPVKADPTQVPIGVAARQTMRAAVQAIRHSVA